MTSRPQFSLRLLMFVIVMVCLAAATAAPLPQPRPMSLPPGAAGGGGMSWEDYGFAIHAQSWLRLAACVAFPAVFTAGANVRRGYVKTFCLGAILPTAMPLWLVCCDAFDYATTLISDDRFDELIELFEQTSYGLANRIAFLWVCAPCFGLACVFFRWFLRLGNARVAIPRGNFAARLLLVAVFAAGLAAAMIKLPRSGQQLTFFGQLPIRLTLCVLVPSVLVVAAVEGRGYLRTFSACGFGPALIPLLLVCSTEIWEANDHGKWETFRIFDWRYFIVLAWTLVPCFGLAAVFFHWLFQRGAAKAMDPADQGEKSG